MENRKKIVKNSVNRKIKEQELKEALKKPPFSSSKPINNRELENIKKERLIRRDQAKKKTFNNELKKVPMAHLYNNRNQSKGIPKLNEPMAFVYPESKVVNTPAWFTNTKPVDVSIIVPMYKSHDVIKNQIAHWVNDDDGLSKEIIYVDDCCPNKSNEVIIPAWEKAKDKVVGKIIINQSNCGYGPSCNIGAKHASGKYLIFLNADTVVTPNWIKPMHECFNDETVGMVGNMHLKDNDTIDSLGSEWLSQQKSFLHIGKHTYKGNPISQPFKLSTLPEEFKKVRDVKMVTGACFMIERSYFFKIKQFDTEYRIGYWEDTDLCMKCHMHGKRIVFTPDSKIYHKSGHSNAGGHPYQLHNRNTFFKKWLDTGLLDGILKKENPKIYTEIPKENIVVYTAITKNYDILKEQRSDLKKSAEFIAFLDDNHTSNTWQIEKVTSQLSDPNRSAKIYKIMPHKFFPTKEYSLWIDGSITIDFQYDLSKLIAMYLQDADLAIFQHPQRTCLYQEASVCMTRNLDSPDIIRKQIARYTKEGYPINNGLVEATVILRRHTDKVKEFNELWWDEICKGSRRDQISFNYVAYKTGLKFNYFNGNLRKKNYLFNLSRHNK